MGERATQKTQTLSYYIMCFLFFFGNIKFIKMFLAYLGITTGITAIATGVFVILEVILLFYFLYQVASEKMWGMFALVVTINAIYGLPYLLNGMFYESIQYCVFMVPFTVAAYLIVFDKDGLSRFFSCLGNISRIGVWFFLTYLVLLFVCEPGEYGVFEIKEMSYGDIAYAALPFLLTDLGLYLVEENRKKRVCAGGRVLVYLGVLIYTGTRSAMVCMVFAIALQVVCNVRSILRMGLYRCVGAIMAVFLCVIFCLSVIPTGARLNVVRSNGVYELMGNRISSIFDVLSENREQIDYSAATEGEPNRESVLVGENSEQPVVPVDEESEQFADSLFVVDFSPYAISCVYNTTTGQYMDISEAFEYYVVNSNKTISETESLLRQDIIDNAGRYLIVNPEYYTDAIVYTLPMNSRVYLWSTAWKEFRTAPVIGHGALYYQKKYENTFPHNVVLEIMADYGVVGLAIIALIILFFFIYDIVTAAKTSDRSMGELLILLSMYIPMHLLYHSLYSNGILIFTVSILVFLGINKGSTSIVGAERK